MLLRLLSNYFHGENVSVGEGCLHEQQGCAGDLFFYPGSPSVLYHETGTPGTHEWHMRIILIHVVI